jgi:DNA polymerase-3 subunit alpha
MAKQKTRFVSGAIARGHDEQKVADLFDLLAKFAEYGFNKSHSAAYGYVAYQTAWLKAHHRAEYMAALLTIDAGDTDKILVYIGDCRRAGMKVLPPDVNESFVPFDVPKNNRKAIRYGLSAVKGIGAGAAAAVIEAREGAKGRFRDFMDMLERLDYKRVNKRVLENLIKCGAMDCFGEPRARLFAALEGAMASAQDKQANAAQVTLFGAASGLSFRMPNVAEWPTGQRMEYEREALGLFLTGHPVEAYAKQIERWATARISDAPRLGDEAEAALCGMVSSMRVIKTKKGDKMAFVQLEDLDGSIECVFFPEALSKSSAALGCGKPVLVRGTLERKADEMKLLADSVELMEDVRQNRTAGIEVHVKVGEIADDALDEMVKIFERDRGSCWTRIVVEQPGVFVARVKPTPQWRVAVTPRLYDGLTALFGERSVTLH